MNSDGPLHIAAQHNAVQVVELLLDRGANVDMRNNNGDTPLHVAVKNNFAEMTRLLLCKGADMYVKNLLMENVYDVARENHANDARLVVEDYGKCNVIALRFQLMVYNYKSLGNHRLRCRGTRAIAVCMRNRGVGVDARGKVIFLLSLTLMQ